MNQFDFDLLLEKYLAGNCTAEERLLLETWAAEQPDNDDFLNREEKIFLKKKLWKRVAASTRLSRKRAGFWFNSWFRAVAASLLVLGVWQVAIRDFSTQKPQTSGGERSAVSMVEMQNPTPEPKKFVLEDGTVVWLRSKSRMTCPVHFGQDARRLELAGEARFNVTPDKNRPFIVRTGDLVTEVLGTSFVISSPGDKATVEVAVLSGKVSVYDGGDPAARRRNGTILTPNQRVTYDKKTRQFIPSLVDVPVAIERQVPANDVLTFDNNRLPEVLNRLAVRYGTEIIIDNEKLRRCVFTGDLTDLPLFDQLDLVCGSLNARYDIRGTHIFVSGEGCP